jgi:predicted nucleotidyltransferase component of viral defense system
MIPRASIVAWSASAPWSTEDQVEQDLILSRLLVEIATDPLLAEALAFRGGTCLHKLHLEEPQRYSEDLDFVRTNQRPILGEVFDRLRAITERIGLREHRRTFPSTDSDTATMWFDADAESGAGTIRVKVEINVAESTPHSDHVYIPFEVASPWWGGSADVRTFPIEEILATKVRALCQRRKGRDLFDLWIGLNLPEIDAGEIAAALGHYMQDRIYSYPQLAGHLRAKLGDPDFAADLNGLVRSVPAGYDVAEALELIRRRIGLELRNVPDNPTPIGRRQSRF